MPAGRLAYNAGVRLGLHQSSLSSELRPLSLSDAHLASMHATAVCEAMEPMVSQLWELGGHRPHCKRACVYTRCCEGHNPHWPAFLSARLRAWVLRMRACMHVGCLDAAWRLAGRGVSASCAKMTRAPQSHLQDCMLLGASAVPHTRTIVPHHKLHEQSREVVAQSLVGLVPCTASWQMRFLAHKLLSCALNAMT